MPALMNCGTVRVVYSAPSKWYRVLCSRHLQLWCPSSPSSFLPESLDTKVASKTANIVYMRDKSCLYTGNQGNKGHWVQCVVRSFESVAVVLGGTSSNQWK